MKVAFFFGSDPALPLDGVVYYARHIADTLKDRVDLEVIDVPGAKAGAGDVRKRLASKDVVQIMIPCEAWKSSLPALSMLIGRLGLSRKGKCLGLSIHEWRGVGRRWRMLFQLVARFFDLFVFISPQVEAEFFKDVKKGSRQRSLIVPLGLHLDVRRPTHSAVEARRAELGYTKDAYVIGSFGAISSVKHSLRTIELLAVLRKSGTDARALFVGEFSGEPTFKAEFWALADQLWVREFIKVTGFIESEDEVTDHLCVSNLLASMFQDGLSARRSSFWVLAQFGIPVLTSPVNELEHLDEILGVADPNHVLYVPETESVESLAHRVLALPKLPPFSYVGPKPPTWEDIADRHVQVWQEILAEKRRS